MTQYGYRDIADAIRSGIQRGDPPPGKFLPQRHELAELYGVSIGTVQRAIHQLHAEGVVDPVRGHGVKIRDRNVIRLEITRYLPTGTGAGPWGKACAAHGQRGTLEMVGVSQRDADSLIASMLGIPEGAGVILRQNKMLLGPTVVQIQDTWLPRWVADGTPLAGLGKVPGGIYQGLITAGYTPSRVEDVVSSRMPTTEEARSFRLRLGSPVLDTRQNTWDAKGRVLVHKHFVVAGDSASQVYQQAL